MERNQGGGGEGGAVVKILTMEQRSPEWFAARVGRLTGTGAKELFAKGRGSAEAVGRRDLRVRLALEQLTGQAQEDGYTNAVMQRGIEKEPVALAAYELHTESTVWPVGFVQMDDLMAGCSPDGSVDGLKGIVEVKCPKSATHLEYLRAGEIPSEYLPQCIHNLWVTGAQWCDFVSFDDRFPDELQLFVCRLTRNEEEIRAYNLLARMFLTEVENEIKAVKALRPVVAA